MTMQSGAWGAVDCPVAVAVAVVLGLAAECAPGPVPPELVGPGVPVGDVAGVVLAEGEGEHGRKANCRGH